MYLDHAAATPIDPLVVDAMMPYFSDRFFNPSSPYSLGVGVKRDYQDAKHRIAQVLGVQKDELIMTAGATESINVAFSAAFGNVAVSPIEHASVLSAAKRAGNIVKISSTKSGHVDMNSIKEVISPELDFISVGLVNNELGTLQPIEDIARLVEAERRRRRAAGETRQLVFHTDASQAAALIDTKPKRLGIDLMTLSAAKVYGPKQVGLLWVKPGVSLKPTLVGGGQELGIRSGTENVAGVIGFAVALELAAKRRSGELKHLKTIRDTMSRRFTESIPDVIVSSDKKRGLVSFLNVSFPGVDAERLIFWLEKRGVMVATGSACAANKGTKSHVLEEIGLSDDEINGSLRISLGRLSSVENCSRATELIIEAVNHERGRTGR